MGKISWSGSDPSAPESCALGCGSLIDDSPTSGVEVVAPSPPCDPPTLVAAELVSAALSVTAAAKDDVVSMPAFRRSSSFPTPVLTTQRSSTGMEHLETVAQQAFDTLMKPSMRIAAAGLLCLIGPPALLLSVPIVLLLLPLLFPLGLVLTAVGLTRAGIVASFDGSRVWTSSSAREPRAPMHSSSPSTPTGLHVHRHRTARSAQPEALGRDSARASLGAAGSVGAGRDGAANAAPYLPTAQGGPRLLRASRTPEHRVATIDGSLSTLNSLTTQRGERLVRQVGTLVRHNVARATHDIRAEVEVQLQALQRELQSWVGANPNLKPYCHGRIGWLLRREPPGAPDVTDTFLRRYLGDRTLAQPAPSLSAADVAAMPMPDGMAMADLEYLLVPGLLTKWYPLYMAQLRADFKRLGLRATFSRIDTDQPVRVNAARVRHEILELAQGSRSRVVILGHSKGAVDAAAALSLFPELVDPVAALVSVQGPHGGSALAHDLANTTVQRSVALNMIVERLLRGCRHAVLDLSFSARQEFIEAHPYPVDRVPSLCLASCDRGASSLLKPVIDFFALRYGEWSDGCVCQADSILPGCTRVLLDDMDHFGPGWPSFPATDRYDPARLWLLATSLALTTPRTAGASAARGAKGACGRPDGGGSSPAEADAGGREAAPRARGVAAKRRHRRHGTDT